MLAFLLLLGYMKNIYDFIFTVIVLIKRKLDRTTKLLRPDALTLPRRKMIILLVFYKPFSKRILLDCRPVCTCISQQVITAREIKFSIRYFSGKCDQIRSFLQIWSHLLKKLLIENFLFCAVDDVVTDMS